MRRSLPFLVLASFLLTGCPSEPAAPLSSPTQASAPAATPTAVDQVYPVVCGCTLDEVGHCGEYAEVTAGSFVEIQGELGLGDMPFCGKSGLEAEIKGQLADGALQATSLALVE